MASNVYEKLKKAGEWGRRAVDLDTDDTGGEDTAVTFQTYMVAISHFEYCYKYAPSADVKAGVKNTMLPFIDRATELKELLGMMRERRAQAVRQLRNHHQQQQVPSSSGEPFRGPQREVEEEEGGRGNPELRKALQSALLDDKPSVRLNDVVGLEEAKKALNMAVIMPMQAPQLFEGNGMKPWNGILLYGPPGTGKTFIAKAVAGECGATFFSISSSNIRDKWVGQSEKMVAELFSMARERAPSVIFMDEIETLIAQRGRGGDGVSTHDDKLTTEILAQMDGVKGSNKGVLVLGATNFPWIVDEAARRRFQRRVYVPLPERLQRAEMFMRGFLRIFAFERAFIEELSDATTHYSGSDIDTMIQLAKSMPIEEVMCATHFKPDPRPNNNGMSVPCVADEPEARAMTFSETADKTKFASPPLHEQHIRRALKRIKPSVDPGTLAQYDEWTAKFGVEGGAE